MGVTSMTEVWPDPANPQIRHFKIRVNSLTDTSSIVQKSAFLPEFGHLHPTLNKKSGAAQDYFAYDFDLRPATVDQPFIWDATVTYSVGPEHTAPGAAPVFSPVIKQKWGRDTSHKKPLNIVKKTTATAASGSFASG